MKKITALFICFLLLFSVSACSGGDAETTLPESTRENTVIPKVKLVLDSAAVVAGETVDIVVNISQAPMTACFDIEVYSPPQLAYESSASAHAELIIASNIVKSSDEECIAVQGMVATTCDLIDDNICVIKYKVSDDVKSGDELILTVKVPSYELGIDKNGNDVYSVASDVITEMLTLVAE